MVSHKSHGNDCGSLAQFETIEKKDRDILAQSEISPHKPFRCAGQEISVLLRSAFTAKRLIIFCPHKIMVVYELKEPDYME